MNRVIGVILCLMILATAYVVGTIVYRVGFEEGRLWTEETALVKHPIQYGVWKAFYTERVEIEPETWHTAEELGVVFIKSKFSFDRYGVYIVNGQEDKALAWMRESYVPYVVKHGDEFYGIMWFDVDPGISTSALTNSLGALLLLILGWAFFVKVAYSKRSEGKPKLKDIILVLLVITIVWTVVLYHNFQGYQQWKQLTILTYPPELRPYMDFDPYFGSFWVRFLIGGEIFLCVLISIVYVFKEAYQNAKKATNYDDFNHS